MNVYRQLAEGGGYNLPYLAHLRTPDGTTHVYLINDNKDMTYNGHTYAASAFTFTPSNDGDSALSIEVAEHDGIIDILENNYHFVIEITGVFNGEEVEEIGQYGEGTWDGKKLELKMKKDDRGGMTFPALIFNAYNNRGNA